MGTKCLYKYREWSRYSDCPEERDRYRNFARRFLTHSEIYFTSPSQFNDPFDCKVTADLSDLSVSESRQTTETIVRLANPEMDDKDIKTSADRLSSKGQLEPFQDAQKNEEFLNLFGIFSLAAIRDSILMWSHYAKKHTGFCVGLDLHKLEEFLKSYFIGKDFPIERLEMSYRTERPMLILPEGKNNRQRAQRLKTIFQTKSIGWAYEEEERLLIKANKNQSELRSNDRTVTLDAGIITEVILGCRMDDRDREEISGIVREKHPSAKLYQAEPMKYEFGLDMSLIDD